MACQGDGPPCGVKDAELHMVGRGGNRVGWAGQHPNTCLKPIQEEVWAEEEEIYLNRMVFMVKQGAWTK